MRVNHFCQFETRRRCRDAPRCSPARVRERARFCFGADARKQHGAGNAYHASRFVRPQFVGHLWNAESLKWFWKQKGFFFNPRENWSCSILLSARESQRGQVRTVGGSISVLCHSVPFDANTGSLKVRNVPIRGKMLFILFFFILCCELLQQQPPPLRSGDEATSLPRSLDRLKNTIRWQTICFIREREMKKYEGM